jgi:hypothetical protein
VNVLQLNSQKIKSRQHLQVGGFFSWGVKRLLLTWRQIRAAAMRHFCRHADAFAQLGVGVNGFADVYRFCAIQSRQWTYPSSQSPLGTLKNQLTGGVGCFFSLDILWYLPSRHGG